MLSTSPPHGAGKPACPLPGTASKKMGVYCIVPYLFNFFIKHSEEFLLTFRDVHAERQRQSISTNRTFPNLKC